MDATKKLWLGLGTLLVVSFAVLLWAGTEIFRSAPPMPERVVAEDGRVLYTRADIERGRQVWQSMGGMQLGSIWGHGGYVAPDWSADWLHREAMTILDAWAAAEGAPTYRELPAEQQGMLRARLEALMRPNTFDPQTKTITVPAVRAEAMGKVADHYVSLFGNAPETAELREAYAMKNNTVPDEAHRRALTGFFWWTAWGAGTERPASSGETLAPDQVGVTPQRVTYTNNWPSEPLIGNRPPPSLWVWSAFSVLFLIAGIALLGWHHARTRDEDEPALPAVDPLATLRITPSMRATAKYFWVVLALFLLQILLGAITAHYQVEGQVAYGYALSDILPYSITRTWHTQLAVLWIAVAWLATGLYIAPAMSGHEPRFQRFGVNFLFVSLLIIVVGSFAGQWLAVMQKLGLEHNFWFGHQGWEYADMGRFWQWYLFIGLLLWLVLVGRALWPVLRGPRTETRTVVGLLFLSTVCIGLFFASALMWNEHTHISEVEYWRWWLVHLWVEGFFEVFAAAVMALIFVKLGLVGPKSATTAVMFATIIFMSGGVLGTLHHLYFVGTPTAVVALGASFSALEVVPLAYLGFEAYHTYRMGHATPWMARYRWPILFFIAVSFWNLVGAGLFGFLINPPLSLYYMQGLNLTPLHGHTALFGVYGMLGIALVLFCLRGLRGQMIWNTGALKTAFWCLNIGLALMALLTLLPLGTLQLLAAIEHGYAYARSAEFMQKPIVEMLVWMRVPGDVIFSVGAVALAWFTFRLWVAPKTAMPPTGEMDEPPVK
ncbi:TPA: nitric-oxide reductase large subunit [Stenotrophomonas maltophilia]|uniref:nitric-oxide reductase large subunit n=1 Tax=Stenotrophomonas TaxID=40323 RepID=UPI00130FFB88|nr:MULTISPECIES: nitric-oxide reductase large subunit [Stenotrophomonas]MBN5024128.1 nitric-oxide reductase large subunit [Stenotrophomonas maltophilia]MDH1484156.1 nitric-oxide reductase large subunit [Stenotrophomonas sp. GD03712]WHL19957.1 nitric-oxide reductase large subunit [Stenotrophomonas acidaminiphila]WON67191.1 nitric-oxide reductase large subunit [Stenotrophomonas maltophilia]HDS1106782.1 nitric-oxide reductase large subunit [Stenotrophomonas maltophilia]